jgi:hypothetical protein
MRSSIRVSVLLACVIPIVDPFVVYEVISAPSTSILSLISAIAIPFIAIVIIVFHTIAIAIHILLYEYWYVLIKIE